MNFKRRQQTIWTSPLKQLLCASLIIFGLAVEIAYAPYTNSASHHTQARKFNQKKQFLLPLFDCCALITVKDAEIREEGIQSGCKILFLTAHVEEVVSGELRHKDIVFAINETVDTFLAQSSVKELNGKKVLLAFRHSGPSYEFLNTSRKFTLPLMEILNAKQLNSGSAISQQYLSQIRGARPDKIYPFETCLELLVKEVYTVSTDGDSRYGTRVTAKILKVLQDGEEALSDPIDYLGRPRQFLKLRAGDEFKFAVDPAQWKDGKDLVNKKCVLGFTIGHDDSEFRKIYSLQNLILGKDYSESELDELHIKVRDSFEYMKRLKSQLETYMNMRWTPERIRKFCRPETRWLPGHQDLVATAPCIGGRLYLGTTNGLGSVSWYCTLNDGMPDEYQISVSRGPEQYWILEFHRPSLSQLTDDQIAEKIVSVSEFNGWDAYLRTHWRDRRSLPSDLRDVWPKEITKFIYDKAGKLVQLDVTLEKNHNLKLEVDHDLCITNPLVDGITNKYWTEVCDQLNANINALYKEPE